MNRLLTGLLGMMLVVGLNWTAMAQPPDFEDTLPPRHHGRFDEKMLANIENLRMMKLLEALDLSQEQSEKFVPLFYGFRKDIKDLFDEKNALIENVRNLLAENGPDGRIKEELAKLKQNQTSFGNRQDKFINDCDAILSTSQLARLVIFQERFEREMLESLREFRGHGGQGPMKNKDGKI